MRTIALACSGGMSTSMLEMNMRKAADAQGYACEIHAYPLADVATIEADILLLGPQIGFQKEKIETQVSCPVEVISMRQYGTMDGEGVLKLVKEVLGD